MGDQTKNILIGLFVFAALSVIAFMLLFLHPTVGDEAKMYKIRFADVDKINIGTRVTYGGKPVGEVISVHEVEDPKNPRKTRNGYVYLYEVTVVVDSGVEVFNSDMISARTSGLLGEKSVAITPMAPKPGEQLIEIKNEVLWANEGGTFEETMKEFKGLSDKFEEALDAVTKTFNSINETKLVQQINETTQNLNEFTAWLNDREKWDKIIANVHSFSNDLASAEGTVGKLLRNDDLYLRTNSILSKGEIIMDDINHYGLLYSSDKNWQKVRARRANLLYKLRSPQEFKNYFNDEVNQIYTSLARVNVVLEETDCYDCCLGENPEYRKVFAELLRRVKQIEESVQLYNQQLMEFETCKTELCE